MAIPILKSSINLRQVQYFITVAECGSISLGAQQLHMTQPPLSQAISSLERQLGVQLLKRHPRGVALTEAGRELLVQGGQLLAWADRIGEWVADIGTGLAGRLRVAAVPPFSWTYLPEILKSASERMPMVELEIADPTPGEILRRVAMGQADVGFLLTENPQFLAMTHPEVEVEHLMSLPLEIVLPLKEKAAPNPIDVRDTLSYRWLIPGAAEGFRDMAEISQTLWRTAKIAPPRTLQVSTLQTAIPLIVAGLGVSLMPKSLTEFAGLRLTVRALQQHVSPLHAVMVWSSRIAPSPPLKSFMAITRETQVS